MLTSNACNSSSIKQPRLEKGLDTHGVSKLYQCELEFAMLYWEEKEQLLRNGVDI